MNGGLIDNSVNKIKHLGSKCTINWSKNYLFLQ